MFKYYPSNLEERFGMKIGSDMQTIDVYDSIGARRGCYIKKGEIDYDRVVNLIIYELRHDKLGRMSYDRISI